MKKTIIALLITIIIVSGTCLIGIKKVEDNYNVQLKEVKNSYSELENSYSELENSYSELKFEYEELQLQVYKYMETDEPYKITIEFAGDTHQWSGKNRKSFFNKEESHLISK